MSLSDTAVPEVPQKPIGAVALNNLRILWAAAAQYGKPIFRDLRAGLEVGIVLEECAYPELALALYTLQSTFELQYAQQLSSPRPPQAKIQPMDAYTAEVLQGLWNHAVVSPNCLDGLVEGCPTKDRGLAWSLWKLERKTFCRTRDSDSSPIQSIPSELLSIIFQCLRHASPLYDPLCETSLHDIASHLPASLVCRYWHSVIADLPSLWAPMTLGFGLQFTERALHLSKDVALDVVIHSEHSQKTLPPSAILNLAHMQRIRTLDLRVSGHTLDIISPLFVSSNIPLLQSLDVWPLLAVWPLRDDLRTLFWDETSFGSVPPPQLRCIRLMMYTITPTCPIFQCPLVEIDLDLCDVWSSLDSLISTLQSLPHLRVFHWEMSRSGLYNYELPYQFPRAAFMHSVHPPASLPCLESLALECPTASFAAIMSHIQIPASCTVKLMDDYTFSDPDIQYDVVSEELCRILDSSLGDHLSRWHSAGPFNSLEHLDISNFPDMEPERRGVVIEGRWFEAIEGIPRVSTAFLVADDVEGHLSADVLATVLRCMMRWPAFNAAGRFIVTNHEVMSDERLWSVVLDTLPRVVDVKIEISADSDPSSAVGGLARAISQDRAPLLSSITLRCLSLSAELLQLLTAAFDLRHRQSKPAVSLKLEACDGIGDLVFMREAMDRCGGKLHVFN